MVRNFGSFSEGKEGCVMSLPYKTKKLGIKQNQMGGCPRIQPMKFLPHYMALNFQKRHYMLWSFFMILYSRIAF